MSWVEELNKNIYIRKVLKERLLSLKTIYNKSEIIFPVTARILGFKLLNINNKDELMGRINELEDILGVK